jgi:hypothetical protein
MVRTMKKIVSVLSESPLYFTMTLRDRYELVKRLQASEERRFKSISVTSKQIFEDRRTVPAEVFWNKFSKR